MKNILTKLRLLHRKPCKGERVVVVGVLTLTWYTYMCLPFGALLCEIWYSDRRVFIRDEGAQST